jgi:hypothetical protein
MGLLSHLICVATTRRHSQTILPVLSLISARVLASLGWQVHVTDSAGRQFDPSDFDRLSSLANETAWPHVNMNDRLEPLQKADTAMVAVVIRFIARKPMVGSA